MPAKHFRSIEECLGRAGLNPKRVEGWRLLEPLRVQHLTFGKVAGYAIASDGVHVLILLPSEVVFIAHITNLSNTNFSRLAHQAMPRRRRSDKADVDDGLKELERACNQVLQHQ